METDKQRIMESFSVDTSEREYQEKEYCFPYHYIAKFENNTFKPFFLDTWAINYASTIEFLLGKIGADRARKIVDIGCGDGRFSRELACAFPKIEVTGFDYSSRAINLALAMNPDIENLSFKKIDIIKTRIVEQFDVAVLMEVFEHIPLELAEMFITNVRGLMKKGGVLHLTVPHINKPLEYKHFQHFCVNELLRYLSSDFQVIEVIPFERVALSRRIISKLLYNKYFILNNQKVLSYIYTHYKEKLFYANNEKNCQRIYVKAKAV